MEDFVVNTKKRKPQKRVRVKEKKPMSVKTKMILLALVLCLVGSVILISIYVWNSFFVPVNLAEQTSLTLSGYNGKGTAEVSVESMAGYMEFYETVEGLLSESEDLKNGDELTVSYSYDEELAKELKLRVDDDETTVTVEGLVDPTIVSMEELFDLVDVTFEDISPMITAQVTVKETEGFLQNVSFEVMDPKEFYEDGDILVVEASFDEQLAYECAYELEEGPKGYLKEYSVSSDEAYVTDAEDITSEMIQEMYRNGAKYFTEATAKEYGLRLFSEARLRPMWENKRTFFSWVNPHIISAYFNVVTEEGKGLRETHVNDIKIVYEVTLTQPDGQGCKAEVVVQYTDLIKLADGTIDLQLDSGKIIAASYRNKNIKSLISDTDDGNYSSIKLEI